MMRQYRFTILAIVCLIAGSAAFRGEPAGAMVTAVNIVVVTTASDNPDHGLTLREAIDEAEGDLVDTFVTFAIADCAGPCVIQPMTELPRLEAGGTTIDGTTQPEGVVVNGSLVPGLFSNGLDLASDHNVVRGLVVNGFGYGIRISGSDNLIEGNYIGTDSAGTAPVGNKITGLLIGSGAGNMIRDNLISGNMGFGIEILEGADGNRVEGNYIGTDVTGLYPLPNTDGGLSVEASGILIGGVDPGQPNLIAYNGGDGVSVIFPGRNTIAPQDVTISRNSIFGNGDLAIDLGNDFHGDGVTGNDPGDGDGGPNGLMNFPVLTRAKVTPGKLQVKGMLDTSNPELARVEVFVTEPGGDPSGHGEAMTFLGAVTPNSNGKFTANFDSVAVGTLISATATDVLGNTSELAANIEARPPGNGGR